jgi:Neuraminidase (sialidase)
VVAADARVNVAGDLPNNIDIVVRRSTDQGESWSAPLTIADFGTFGASDPSLVRDRNTGDLLCMFASHQGLMQSTPSNRIRYQVCRSQDNGVSWSSSQEFTNSIYAPGWYAAWQASGSAHQLRSGRIVGAVGVRQNAGSTISNFMICSDDGGQSWNYKPALASAVGNEAKIVELDDGRLMMNIRNQSPDCRKIVISQDSGNSWGSPYYQYTLVDPFVNGDFIRYTSVLDGFNKSRLLFSIAAHPTTRKNLSVFISYDEGDSWPISKVLNPGPSGYSALTVLDDGTIGCFYENGEYEDYQLYFARLSLDFLSDSTDTFTFPTAVAKQQEQNYSVSIFPNPSGNLIKIVYVIKERSVLDAIIIADTGQEVIRVAGGESVSGTKLYTVDASSLKPGVYFLKSTLNGISSTHKIVIQP